MQTQHTIRETSCPASDKYIFIIYCELNSSIDCCFEKTETDAVRQKCYHTFFKERRRMRADVN